ncbi:MAG: SCO family protein [Solirubrobacteraceae bacterium]
MTRLRLVLGTVLACVLAAAIALVLAAANDGGHRSEAMTPINGFDGFLRPPDVPPQDFALRDQDGKVARLADDRGQVVVLTFMYSTCQDTCPVTAQQIRGALDQLGHDIPALAVSVDPANDTPAHAKRFLLEQKLTGRMRFLLGTRAQLAPVWKAYGIQPQGNGFEHSAYVLLIDKHGRQRIGFPVDQLTPEGLAHDIRKLEAESA